MAKALINRSKDGKNTFSLEDVEPPKPQKHYVLVKLRAIAQNPTDIQSFDNSVFPDSILGCDFAGTVDQVGADVSRVKPGDEIGAFTWGGGFEGKGAYAHYALAHQDICFKIPKGFTAAQAATIPLALNTAWLAFFSHQSLRIDRSKGFQNQVLVWGGSSSVGLYAIQIAKIFNFDVATVCSPRNFDLVKKAGAKHVFDYHSSTVVEDIKKALPNLEYVFDTIGNQSSSATSSKTVRAEGGVLCTVRPGKALTEDVEKRVKVTDVLVFTAFDRPLQYKSFHWDPVPEDYKLSAELYNSLPEYLTSGKIVPNKPRVMGDLSRVAEGFQLHRDGKISAEKLVYLPQPQWSDANWTA